MVELPSEQKFDPNYHRNFSQGIPFWSYYTRVNYDICFLNLPYLNIYANIHPDICLKTKNHQCYSNKVLLLVIGSPRVHYTLP